MADKPFSASEKEGHPESRPPRSFWETVITMTPVFLTVLATLLAGLSNSEMTQAQYHRSLAAQFQSKVADQWSFFQAKRIRGSNLELTVELLPATGEKPSRLLQVAVERLPRYLARLEKQAEQLTQQVKGKGPELGPIGNQLVRSAGQIKQAAGAGAREATSLQDKIVSQLKVPSVREAFFCLDARSLPSGEAPASSPTIQKVLASARKDEARQQAPDVPSEELQQAIAQAEALAQKFQETIKPTNKIIDGFTPLAEKERMLLDELRQPIRELADAREELPPGQSCQEIRQGLETVLHTAALARNIVDELTKALKAARYDFKARCYERESRFNQDLAELYEVQVALTSQVSERHRHRSRNLFYGMLAAQGGVTIATFALAVRRKSMLWSMASLTGLGAMVFGSYVYLYM